MQGLGFKVWGAGLRVWGLGFKVWGFRLVFGFEARLCFRTSHMLEDTAGLLAVAQNAKKGCPHHKNELTPRFRRNVG